MNTEILLLRYLEMTDELRLEERLKLAGEEFGCDKVSPHGYHVYYANHLEVYQVVGNRDWGGGSGVGRGFIENVGKGI
jgi:hypothetical protein